MREPEILERIKRDVRALSQSAPHVHMTLSIARTKTKMERVSGTITGVYPRIFTVKEEGQNKTHSVQYTDLLTGLVQLDELKISLE